MTNGTATIKRLGGNLHSVTIEPSTLGHTKAYLARDHSEALGYAVGMADGLGLEVIDLSSGTA